MGPRPFGRGRESIESVRASNMMLQWGRDLSVAEGFLFFNFFNLKYMLQWGRDLSVAEGRRRRGMVFCARPASMGPRPFGRGRWVRAARRRKHKGRFNGAATFRSRKGPPSSCITSARTGFNGAATFRSRKGARKGRVAQLRRSFNGAATFRSRKAARMRPSAGLLRLLQWGRDLSVAEGTRAGRRGHRLGVASMGPRPFGRGRKPRRRRSTRNATRFNGAATFRSRKAANEWQNGQITLASMGPRPFGRGRFTFLSDGGPPCVRFNGAATFRSRKARRGRPVGRPMHASMGPRPFGRGRYVIAHTIGLDRTASMGPRPFGRGRESAAPSAYTSGTCFNGAATFRSRKVRHAAIHRPTQANGFNGAATFRSRKGATFLRLASRGGAASMGPRPFGRGRQRPSRLYRGRPCASMGPRPFGRGRRLAGTDIGCTRRGFNGAATFRSRKGLAMPFACGPCQRFNGAATFRSRKAPGGTPAGRGHDASMGPRPFGRGRVAERPRRSAASVLQWGRDLSVAEGRRAQRRRDRVGRFNGAATFRSRKECKAAFSYAGLNASMGPRPFGRGRESIESVRASNMMLQWGRDLSVAEGFLFFNFFNLKYMLQWGRDLSVAEGRRRRGMVFCARPASMGPRPFGRGRWVRAARRRKHKGRFNGAATFRSRKGPPSSCITSARTGFNGAATFRSRKVPELDGEAIGSALLQWGRDLSVAEGSRAGAAVHATLHASMGPRPFGRGRRLTSGKTGR